MHRQDIALKGIMCKLLRSLRRRLKPFHTYNVWSHFYRKNPRLGSTVEREALSEALQSIDTHTHTASS